MTPTCTQKLGSFVTLARLSLTSRGFRGCGGVCGVGASLEQSLELVLLFALFVEMLDPARGARLLVLPPEIPQRSSGAVVVQTSEVSVPSLRAAKVAVGVGEE